MPMSLPGSLRVALCLLVGATGTTLGQVDKEPPVTTDPHLGSTTTGKGNLERQAPRRTPVSDAEADVPTLGRPDKRVPGPVGDGPGSPEGPLPPAPSGPSLDGTSAGPGHADKKAPRRTPVTHANPSPPGLDRKERREPILIPGEPEGPMPPDGLTPGSPQLGGPLAPEAPRINGPSASAPLAGRLDRRTPTLFDRQAFWDMTLSKGLVSEPASTLLPAASGSAWLDYDRDGDPDLFLAQLEGASRLYRNDEGAFIDVTEAAGAGAPNDETLGVSAADFDGDGWLDLLLLNQGADRLLRNAGDGTFLDVTVQAGIAGDAFLSTGASWADFDGDGDLDVYITTAANPTAPEAFPTSPFANRLFRNEGDGTFVERADALGIAGNGASFGALFTDFDQDGDPDLLVAHDASRHAELTRYYRNDGGIFTEMAFDAEPIALLNATGAAAGDLDNDGDLDLILARQGRDLLALNNGDGHFQSVGRAYGLLRDQEGGILAQGWGATFLDYDSDGFLDLLIAQGTAADPQPLRLYRNLEGAGFLDVSAREGVLRFQNVRTVSPADFDQDGDIDLLIGALDGRYRLLVNRDRDQAHAITVRPLNRSGSPALGAMIRIATSQGNRLHEVGAERTLLSSPDPAALFGLGDSDRADALEIEYPSGVRSEWRHVAAGTAIDASEPALTIEASQDVIVATAGQLIRYTLTFTNHSQSQALAAESRIDVNLGGLADHPWIPTTRIGLLAPQSTVQLTVSILVPAGTPPGTYALVHRIGALGQGAALHQSYLDVVVQ